MKLEEVDTFLKFLHTIEIFEMKTTSNEIL